jgi:hypothetical protein
MRGEKAASTSPFSLHEPGQSVAHNPFAVTAAPLKQLGAVPVCGILGIPAVWARDKKIGRERGQLSAGDTEGLKQYGRKISAGANGLQFRHVAKIRMGDLVRQDPRKLLVVGFLEQARRDIEFAATGVRGVDMRIIHNCDRHLIERNRMVHLLQQRGHDSLQSLCLLRIQWAGSRSLLTIGRWLGRWPRPLRSLDRATREPDRDS